MCNDDRSPESPDSTDTKLLMCALIVGGAERNLKTSATQPMTISESKTVEDALRQAYQDLTRGTQETRTAPFSISRT